MNVVAQTRKLKLTELSEGLSSDGLMLSHCIQYEVTIGELESWWTGGGFALNIFYENLYIYIYISLFTIIMVAQKEKNITMIWQITIKTKLS